MNLLLVFIGGGLGCILRYAIGQSFSKTSIGLPLATFIANLTACLVFALVLWLGTFFKGLPPYMRLLLLTGFCGGLSTFSSFGYETFLLFKQGMMGYALLNILFNTSLCILIFYIFK